MNTEAPAQTAGVPLERQLTFFEYGTCADASQAARLYESRGNLKQYLEKGHLTRSFDGECACLRAAHYVGLLPFSADERPSLLLVAPKGSRHDEKLGLLRFLELVALSEGEDPPDELHGWQGVPGPRPFLLFFARRYARVLDELCRRDFRSDYRHEEGELRSRIRGRLNLPAYARLAVRGKPHLLPCRWDEHTADNWDNRILWGAARRLKRIAAALDPEAARLVWKPFAGLCSWFSEVDESPITASDLRRSRLGRMSAYYRRALAWARLLLAGSELPTFAGQAPSLVLDSDSVFERFAARIAAASLPHDWESKFQERIPFVAGAQQQSRRPDIVLCEPGGAVAVADAKYKQVLECLSDEELSRADAVARTSISASDWDQLYVYMRLMDASAGLFIVPYWKAAGPPVEWFEEFEFARSPRDPKGQVRVAVLALNLMQPLARVKDAAADRLRNWLSESSPFNRLATHLG